MDPFDSKARADVNPGHQHLDLTSAVNDKIERRFLSLASCLLLVTMDASMVDCGKLHGTKMKPSVGESWPVAKQIAGSLRSLFCWIFLMTHALP